MVKSIRLKYIIIFFIIILNINIIFAEEFNDSIKIAPTKINLSVMPGNNKVKEFQIVNLLEKDIDINITENSDFINIKNNNFTIKYNDILIKNSETVYYEVNIPYDITLGDYTEEIYIEANGVKKRYLININIKKKFFSTIGIFLFNDFYSKSYCPNEFNFKNTTCEDIRQLKINNLTAILILLFIILTIYLILKNIEGKR